MSATQVSGLTAQQLNALSASSLQSFAVRQLGAISYSTFLALTAAQTANLAPTQIAGLSGTQVQAMTVDQINGLGKADLQALNVSYLTKTQIAGLTAKSIGNLSGSQVSTLLSSRPGILSNAQLAALTTDQLNSLSRTSLQTINVAALSARQIVGLSTTQVANLSSAQTAALSTAELNGMTTQQIAGFSKAGTQGLTATQLDGMSKINLNAVNVADLSATAVSNLTTKTLTSLTAGQTSSLLANQADKLSVAQISSFSAAQLGSTNLVGAADGLQFNLSWAPSVANAPAGYRNAAIAAAAGLSAELGNKVVVNLRIGYGEVAGSPVASGAAAQSGTYMTTVSYSSLYSALQRNSGNSTIQAAAAASLGASDPTNGGTFRISTAEAKALGLTGASSQLDGYVSLSSAVPFVCNQTAASGKYDAVGVFQHEITEVMGRTGSVGSAFGNGVFTALDLYRYTSTNNANPSQGQPVRALTPQNGNVAYFSIDGGQTNLGGYNPSIGGADFADWNATMAPDPFGYAYSGAVQRMTGNGVAEMAAIGWNMTQHGVTAAQAAATYALV